MNVLLVSGSCRPPRANTQAMTAFLKQRLELRGAATQVLEVLPWRDADPELTHEAIAAARSCQTMIILAPVYVDTLPAPTLRLLERLCPVLRDAADGDSPGSPQVAAYAVLHSGYPEPAHQEAGLRQCGHFASQAGMQWRGGLGFGGASPIDGRPLEQAGRFASHLRQGLTLLADSIVAGEDVSQAATRASRRIPFPLPGFLLVRLMNAMTRRELKNLGVAEPLAHPYRDAP